MTASVTCSNESWTPIAARLAWILASSASSRFAAPSARECSRRRRNSAPVLRWRLGPSSTSLPPDEPLRGRTMSAITLNILRRWRLAGAGCGVGAASASALFSSTGLSVDVCASDAVSCCLVGVSSATFALPGASSILQVSSGQQAPCQANYSCTNGSCWRSRRQILSPDRAVQSYTSIRSNTTQLPERAKLTCAFSTLRIEPGGLAGNVGGGIIVLVGSWITPCPLLGPRSSQYVCGAVRRPGSQ